MDGLDYDGVSNVLLIFNAATSKLDVSVNLRDNSLYEGERSFNGTLVTDSERVTVRPDNALAIIEDDDGVCSQNHIHTVEKTTIK